MASSTCHRPKGRGQGGQRGRPLKRQFAANLAWAAAANWSREIINFCVFLALARLLGPLSYGIMSMVGVATAIANGLLVDGLANFIVRRKQLERAHVNAVFWVQIVVAGVYSLAMIAGSPALATFYEQPEIARIMPVMASLPILYALSSVPAALLQRAMHFRQLTIRSSAAAAGGIIGVVLALAGWGVWSLVLMAVVQWSVTCIVLWTASDWRPGFDVERHHIVDVVRFGSNAIGVKLLVIADQQLPRFVIAASLGAVSLGFFTMAWRIIEVTSILVLLPIRQVTLPTFAKMQEDGPRLRAGVRAIVELTAAISLPCYVGLLAVAPVLVPTVAGHSWDGTILILQLFSAFGVAWALLSSCDSAMVVIDKMRWRVWFTLLSFALLAAGLAISYSYGLAAIALTMVVREIVSCLVFLGALRRHGLADKMDLMRRITPFAASAIIMLAAVLGWQNLMSTSLNGPVLLASSVVAGATVYSIGVMAFARGTRTQVFEIGVSFCQRRKTT
jgi:O-antigen/teichoic acid export membrane protein